MSQELTLMSIDVDGSLANPVMRIAVLAWGFALAVPLVVVFRYTTSQWQRISAILATVVAGAVMSPFANRGIALLIYQINSKPGVGVGLFGGPPPWASPFVALALAGSVALCMGRQNAGW